MKPSTEIAIELLRDYYGEDYISEPEQLIELMEIEFNVSMEREEAIAIMNNLEMMDTYINLTTCL